MSDKKIKVGILCESLVLEKWLTKSIYHVNSLENIELIFLVASSPKSSKSFIEKTLALHKKFRNFLKRRDRIWSIYYTLIVKRKVEALRLISIEQEFQANQKISIQAVRVNKNSFSFSEIDLNKVKQLNLDLVLRAGLGILTGEILNIPKYGIWSFHHGDEFHYRGLPAGFWEIYYSELVCGVVLQKLTKDLDTGFMLQKGYLPTHPRSYVKTLNLLFSHAIQWPAKMIRLAQAGRLKIGETPSYHSPKIFKNPSDKEMLRFFIKMIYKNLAYAGSKLFLTEKWRIGIVKLRGLDTDNRISECIDYANPIWLPTLSKSHFEADPFYVPSPAFPAVLFEAFDYNNRKGVIFQVQWDESKLRFGNPTLLNEQPYHLAYPFCFEFENNIYYYAESYTDEKLQYYKLTDGKWIPHCSLPMPKFISDPTLILHDGLWYMFYTNGLFGSNFQLEIKFSESPFGPFKDHLQNPVKINVSNSRSAGHFIRKNGKLIRPSQNCMEGYGNKITFHEVLKLSPTEYEETFYDQLDAKSFGDQYEGVHTFNLINSNYAVFDVKEYKLILSNSLFLAKKLVKKVLGL